MLCAAGIRRNSKHLFLRRQEILGKNKEMNRSVFGQIKSCKCGIVERENELFVSHGQYLRRLYDHSCEKIILDL